MNENVDGEAKPPAVSVELRQGHSNFKRSHDTTLHFDLHHMHGICRASDEKDDRCAIAIEDRECSPVRARESSSSCGSRIRHIAYTSSKEALQLPRPLESEPLECMGINGKLHGRHEGDTHENHDKNY